MPYNVPTGLHKEYTSLTMPYNVDFQNGSRVKIWSLLECSKRFLFLTDY